MAFRRSLLAPLLTILVALLAACSLVRGDSLGGPSPPPSGHETAGGREEDARPAEAAALGGLCGGYSPASPENETADPQRARLAHTLFSSFRGFALAGG